MNKLILIFLVTGCVIWELGSCHRPPPSRHHLRLQRMAPRHPRPPRHYPAHPNMIPIPQAAGGAAGVKPLRSYKPRLHIPLLHGLTHRHHPRHHPGHPGHHPGHRPHNHNHHHHHHHPGHPGHPGHFHGHPGHHHHPHHAPPQQQQQQHPHHHPPHFNHQRPQQQQNIAAAGLQQHRLPQNQFGNAFAKPQLQLQHQQHQQQHSPAPAPFGYPPLGVDATPAHSAHPVGPPPRQPIRPYGAHPQRVPSPPFGFKQDPEIPFGNEPVQELPTSTGAYHPSTQGGLLPHTTAAYGDTSATPNGFLASTYKGWKPIVKPYQSSYPRGPGPEHQHQHQHQNQPQQIRPAGLPDFPRTPQEFPQISNNHLPGFPIDDFPSGPSGPPSPHNHNQQQEHQQRGPPENIFDGFSHIPDPPNFSRTPPTASSPDNNLLDFSNGPGSEFHNLPPTGHPRQQQHQHQQQSHPQQGQGLFQSHQQPTSSMSHQDLSFPSGPVGTTPRDEFPSFNPSGGGDPFRGDILRPQFNPQSHRGNILKQGLHHHNHQNNNNNQDVIVPIPEIGDSVRLPNSIFSDNSWAQNNRDQGFEASQSEENVVIKKPQKFNSKLKLNQGNPIGSSDETIENNSPLTVLPKFKPPRPRLNKNNNNNNDEGKSDEPEGRGPPKLSLGSDEGSNDGKPKQNNGRGRVRIRTRLRRPNPFSNSGEDEQSGGGPGPGSNSNGGRPFPPFPGSKNEGPRRPPFRKVPNNENSQDNNLSTENPNNSGQEDGPPPGHGGPPPPGHIKGPISEELSNFPTLPFPPPEPDFIRESFPSPPQPPAPVPPPPSPPPKEREPIRHSLQRPDVGIRQNNAGSGEEQRESPRPNLRRRRPKPPPKQQNDHPSIDHGSNDSSEQIQQSKGGRPGEIENQQNQPPLPPLNANGALFSDEFFFPPGFNADPSKQSTGGEPVSFITMPNAKPHVIHHGLIQQQQQQQQGQGPSSSEGGQPPHPLPPLPHQPHNPHLYRGPQTQHFPPLEEFGLQGVNPGPYIRPNPAHGNPHPGHQLPSYSEHLPFARPPARGRKPPRGSLPPTKPPHVLNPYAYPTSNPYAVTGPYADSAPQTSNSYEVPDTSGMFGARPGPVYHPPHMHPGPAPHIQAPGPSPLPLPRPSHVPPPPRGRLPGGRIPPPHHRKPPMADPSLMSGSTEFEQIPAQYVDVSNLPTSSSSPTSAPSALATQARQHEHHSPDIHPPGSFFDDFFKPFDDSFVQKPGEAGGAGARADNPNMEPAMAMEHDEQQSQSNVQVNVVPSPKNLTETTKERKPWSKLKTSLKDGGDSTEKPRREPAGKKPLSGRFNNKNHLKAKIADIARKNFQNHLSEAGVEGKEKDEHGHGVQAVTTYKPALLELSSLSSSPIETSSQASGSRETSTKHLSSWTKNAEDDLSDTSIPKSVRFSKNEGGPMLIHHRGKNSNSDGPSDTHPTDGTTILFKSKRQFRRKRPGQSAKPAPEAQTQTSEPHNPEASSSSRSPIFTRSQKEDSEKITDQEDKDSSGGTTRVGVIRRRKLFPRRRNFSLSTKDSTQAPEAESVTYGESQWFRVKKMESGEEINKENHEGSGGLNSPSPTPESKTVSDDHHHNHEDDLSSSSSTNLGASNNSKSRKLSHSESVSSSVSSSSSSSSSSKNDDRPFGKKSSKFLMNRLSMA